jgi:tape measure domain-containing protein
MSAIIFDASLQAKQMQEEINKINQQLKNFVRSAEQETGKIDHSFQNLGRTIAGIFTLQFGANLARQIATVRGEFQQLEVALETMLGSKAKADALMAQVVEFASTTPFELKDVASATKMLLAYGTATEDVIPTMRALGDVSAGLSIPIERLILNYGQVRMQAKLTGKELRDFAVMGVPIVAEMAKNLNKTEKEITEMVTAGRIGFKEVEDAFKSMASEGGKFENLMAKQSTTITGMISNLQDAWAKMLNSIGAANESSIANVISTAKTIVENYETVVDILKALVATYGIYKGTLIAVSVAQKVAGIGEMIDKYNQLRKTLIAVDAAQKAFNISSKASIYGIALAGITALIGAFTIYRKKQQESAEFSRELNKSIYSEVTSLNALFRSLKQAEQGTQQRTEAIKKVNSRYGEYLGNLLTEKSTIEDIEQAQKRATEAMIARVSVMAAEKELTEQISQISNQYQKEFGKFLKVFSETYGADRLPEFVTAINDAVEEQIKAGGGKIERGMLEYSKIAEKVYLEFVAEISRSTGAIDFAFKDFQESFLDFAEFKAKKSGPVEYLNTLIDTFKNLLNVSSSSTDTAASRLVGQEIKDIRQQIKTAENELNRLRKEGSELNYEAISQQEDTIKSLQDKLQKLTGVSVKEASKMIKAEQEKFKAIQEYNNAIIEEQARTESARIAIMEDGRDKQLRELDLALNQELNAIQQRGRELLKQYNQSLGFAETDSGYVRKLPDALQTELDQQEILVKQNSAKRKEEIERTHSVRIGELRRAALETFMSDQDLEVAAVERKWAEINQQALSAGNFEQLKANEEARQKELYDIRIKFALMQLDFEQDIALRRAELENTIFSDPMVIEKKKIQIYQQFARERLQLLKKANSEAAASEVESIEVFLLELEKKLGDIADQESERVIFAFREIASIAGDIDAQLGKALNSFAMLAENALKAFTGFAKGGDIFSGLLGAFGIISTIFSISRNDRSTEKLLTTLEKINLTIEQQSRLMAALKGESWFTTAKKQADDLTQAININRKAFDDSYGAAMSYIEYVDWFINLGLPAPSFQEYELFMEQALAISKKTIDEIIRDWKEGNLVLTKDQELILQNLIEDIDKLGKLYDETWQKATGSTRDSIADAIIDGFMQGKRSAEDFADTFEDLMKRAVLNSIKLQLIEGPIADYMRSFSAMAEDGINESEVAQIRDFFENLVTGSRELWDQLTKIPGLNFGIDGLGPEGMKGQIKGITEDTASLIAGQFYAMRELDQRMYELMLAGKPISEETLIYNKQIADLAQKSYMTGIEQLDVMNQSVTHLAEIASNTRYNKELVTIREEIKNMNSYLKNAI